MKIYRETENEEKSAENEKERIFRRTRRLIEW